MADITIHDKVFTPFLTRQQISDRNAAIGAEINSEYAGKNPLMIGILNGSFIFAADLFRQLTIPAEISFVKLASYEGTSSSGNVTTAIGLTEDLRNRHV